MDTPIVPTRAQAIAGAAAVLAAARHRRAAQTIEDAARAALRAGGPSYAQLVAQLTAERGLSIRAAA